MIGAIKKSFNLEELLAAGSVVAHFQPIISIKERTVVGVEGLCRGVHPHTGELIPPLTLFKLAAKQRLLIDLDRLCRRRVLEQFKFWRGDRNELVLWLNLESSLFDMGLGGSNHLVDLVREIEIDPGRIVIELVESRVNQAEALKRFAQCYKKFGFLLALDDVGQGHSNLSRVPLVKPDSIKIDRSLISSLDTELHKQEVVRALVGMAHGIGALAVAEGVETGEEALTALELGVDFMQGFYFAKPKPLTDHWDHHIQDQIIQVARSFGSITQKAAEQKRQRHMHYEKVVDHLAEQLTWVEAKDFQRVLDELIGLHSSLGCLFMLNLDGIQVTETIFNPGNTGGRRKALFRPAMLGSDMSLQSYYLMSRSDRRKHITAPYISMATGNCCITISQRIHDSSGQPFILCADFELT